LNETKVVLNSEHIQVFYNNCPNIVRVKAYVTVRLEPIGLIQNLDAAEKCKCSKVQ